MGLFDKILGTKGGEDTKLTKQEGFMSIMLLTVGADGHLADEEVASLITTAARMQLFRGMNGSQFQAMIKNIQGLAKKHGAGWLMSKAVEALPAELKPTIFAISAELIFADGSVEEAEKKMLEEIQKAVGVADDLALKIIEVIQIKNRG